MAGSGAPVLRAVLRGTGAALVLAVLTVLTALGGGVTGPAGLLLPVAMIFFALYTPPRQYLVVAAAGVAGYWGVAVRGGEPAAYPLVCTLAFGGVAFLCLAHARALVSLRRRLAAVSRTDPLTLCLNRRGTEKALSAELAAAERTGSALAVMLVDLDGFKAINDTYGHQAGDDLLAWTARTLTGAVRGQDVVGRIGGDEFAVILPGAGDTEAAAIADRLRTALDGVAPASVGYACFPADGRTVPELSHAADTRTYADKLTRTRVPPTPAAVAGARAQAGPRSEVAVLPHERRRRSIIDMGWLAICNFSVGTGYVLLSGSPHRPLLAALAAGGLICGYLLIRTANRLSRSAISLRILMLHAAVAFPLGATMAVLDGGALSPLALGLLSAMPLIALGAPARVTVPVIGGLALLYVGVAVFGGAPSRWFVAGSLAAAFAASLICGVQGRAAAAQRLLLTRLTRCDPLTEVLNRRGFEEEFALRADRPVALLIFDLDGFKQVNDVQGHAAGDELLCWVAATLTGCVTGRDVVGRLGGDEFVVLVEEDPEPVARCLRTALGARTAVSVGTAVRGVHGIGFDDLYAHADAELYRQKVARSGPPEPQVHGQPAEHRPHEPALDP